LSINLLIKFKNMALKPHRVGRRKASKSRKTAKRLEIKRVMLEAKTKKKSPKKKTQK